MESVFKVTVPASPHVRKCFANLGTVPLQCKHLITRTQSIPTTDSISNFVAVTAVYLNRSYLSPSDMLARLSIALVLLAKVANPNSAGVCVLQYIRR